MSSTPSPKQAATKANQFLSQARNVHDSRTKDEAGWTINIVMLVITLVLVMGLGAWLSSSLVDHAGGSKNCPGSGTQSAAASNASSPQLALSGLPSSIPFTFGYGRGAQTFETTFTANAASPTLPRRIESLSLPLTTADGQRISAVTAVATRIDQTHTYLLSVCMNASANGGADPGSYSGSLVFPNASVPQGTNPLITASLQSQFLPYVLWVFGPPTLLLSLLYAAMILIRRGKPNMAMGSMWRTVLHDLWSANGVVAVVLGIGAGFGVWKAQCFLNPTWGASWPDIAIGIVSMGAAIVTAASVPLAFSSQPVEEQKK